MTLQATRGGYFPNALIGNPRFAFSGTTGGVGFATVGTMDAAAEKVAFVGQVFWDGEPAGAKTMGATSKIHFRTGVVTFADPATNLRIGLQDVLGTGTTLFPDGTFDVYADVAGDSGTITSSDDNVGKTVTLATSGTKDLTHGQMVAVVFDMTARGGSDSVIIAGLVGAGSASMPACLSYVSSWFLGSSGLMPNVMLEAADGTLGVLRGGTYITAGSAYSYQASSSPDEYALLFEVPFRCRIDAAVVSMSSNAAAADGTLRVYQTPLGTPSEMTSVTVLGEQGNGSTTEAPFVFQFSSSPILEPNTVYAVALDNTGTAVFDVGYVTLGAAAHRSVLGLVNCRRGSRSNGSGAFAETTTEYPLISVYISALDDGVGGAAGLASRPMNGGFQG